VCDVLEVLSAELEERSFDEDERDRGILGALEVVLWGEVVNGVVVVCMTEVCRVRRNECQESQEEVVSEQPRYLTR
jgi:hypothetical protein